MTIRSMSWRLGRRIYMYARKDVPNDMRTNGEISLVGAVLRTVAHPILFDVGANVGEWTQNVLAQAPPEANLHAFEPVPSTFEVLRASISDNRARLNCLALSDSDERATMYEYGGGTPSLHRDLTKPEAREIDVFTSTADRYIEENGIGEVSYFKCDAEGHDFAVIRGTERSLDGGKIGVLQFEYNHRWVFSRTFLLDVFELVSGLPYLLGKILPTGVEIYDGWHPELERFFDGNYVLVRSDLLDVLPASRGGFDASNTYRSVN